MALTAGYGVLVGTITDYYRDPPDNYGRYYHGNIKISTSTGVYHCAVDVDSKKSNVGVEWRTLGLLPGDLSSVVSLGVGWHALASAATSGAMDYVRSPMLAARIGCLRLILRLLGRDWSIAATWKRGTSVQALADLEPLVQTTRAAGLKTLVFGEPFTVGLGVHNIHQNQGDPAGSTWWTENGIWQDGITILQQDANNYRAFMNKFTSQSYMTDSSGHPA